MKTGAAATLLVLCSAATTTASDLSFELDAEFWEDDVRSICALHANLADAPHAVYCAAHAGANLDADDASWKSLTIGVDGGGNDPLSSMRQEYITAFCAALRTLPSNASLACALVAEARLRRADQDVEVLGWQERAMAFGKNPANKQQNLRPSRTFHVHPHVPDAVAARRQQWLVSDPRASCDDVGICVCDGGVEAAPLIFDGRRCVPMAGWESWGSTTSTLLKKWTVVPAGQESYDWGTLNARGGIVDTAVIARNLPINAHNEAELARIWSEASSIDTFTMFYASIFNGKRVLDVGSGFARQSMGFAYHGASVTFVDVAPTNLALLERVANALEIPSERVRFVQLKTLDQLRAELGSAPVFDVVCAFGSLHHAPREVTREEFKVLIPLLRVGGKWLQLAYSQDMWLRPGARNFASGWGGDGKKCPWTDWYEEGKLLKTLSLAGGEFATIWSGEVVRQFVWFDLLKLASRAHGGPACST